jgi:hypothetical protein
MRKADIHLINYENLGWLADTIKTYFTDQGAPAPFQGIVFDELSQIEFYVDRGVVLYPTRGIVHVNYRDHCPRVYQSTQSST